MWAKQEPTIGTCPKCEWTGPLDDEKKVGMHKVATTKRGGRVEIKKPCRGVGKIPAKTN